MEAHNGYWFTLLVFIIPWLSVISTTFSTIAFFWVARHYTRYNMGLIFTSFFLMCVAWRNNILLLFPNATVLHSRLYTHHIWYDISFILVSFMIVKCGIRESYMREIVCKK